MASEKNTIMGWVDRRLPVTENLERHLTKHPVPKKVNFFYLFGALLMVVFMIQVVTGIWLMMFYTNTEEGAFASVEYIMRDVEYGWLMRYMHSTGASAFFFLMFFHMFITGRRVFGVRASLGSDVILGSKCDFVAIWSNSFYRA